MVKITNTFVNRMNEEDSGHDAAFLEYFPFYNFTEWAVDNNSSQDYLQVSIRYFFLFLSPSLSLSFSFSLSFSLSVSLYLFHSNPLPLSTGLSLSFIQHPYTYLLLNVFSTPISLLEVKIYIFYLISKYSS